MGKQQTFIGCGARSVFVDGQDGLVALGVSVQGHWTLRDVSGPEVSKTDDQAGCQRNLNRSGLNNSIFPCTFRTSELLTESGFQGYCEIYCNSVSTQLLDMPAWPTRCFLNSLKPICHFIPAVLQNVQASKPPTSCVCKFSKVVMKRREFGLGSSSCFRACSRALRSVWVRGPCSSHPPD